MSNELLRHPLDFLTQDLLDEGRIVGNMIELGVDVRVAMQSFSLSPFLNTFGCPLRFNPIDLIVKSESYPCKSLLDRCALYEMLGYIDPNLAFAAPGPGMSAFVVSELGSSEQQNSFFGRFKQRLTWSFFGLTEESVGSDSTKLEMSATPCTNGFRLNGVKYLIGNGAIADVGIVFARTHPGPMGINAFVVECDNHRGGLSRHKINTLGCPGAGLARLVFDDVFVPESALLGSHLSPVARNVRSASATFKALRPCIAAISVGIARAALDRFSELPGRLIDVETTVKIDAARLLLREICRDHATQSRKHGCAGLLKAVATNCSEAAIMALLSAGPPNLMIYYPWLAKAYRDVKAFEYTEGVSTIHYLSYEGCS